MSSMRDFIRSSTNIGPLSFLPDIQLHQANDDVVRACGNCTLSPTPFWAFAWPGGQALARYLLDHPEQVRNKRVLDFASGSGLVGIAAAKAGASQVLAFDIDPVAREATQLNAALNSVRIENLPVLRMDKPFKGVDLIVTGDICYSQGMAAAILRWLYYCIDAGTPVVLGDPSRAYAPKSGLKELVRYDIPVLRELEDADTRTASVWEVSLPEDG